MIKRRASKNSGPSASFVLLFLLPACGGVVSGQADAGHADAPRMDGAPTDETRNDRVGADLASADLASADLASADLASGDLAGADADRIDLAKIEVGIDAMGKDDAGMGEVADRATTCRQAPVALRGADNFAVLAGPTVTNTGLTLITGDLGVSPGTAITGFPPGSVVGLQHADDAVAAQAQADLKTAYDDAAGRTLCTVPVVGNLGGKTLGPGLYTSPTSLEISAGDLTLDAGGDTDAVFLFQMTTTLSTTAGRQVILSGGARAANVFWQVGTSATLGATSAFVGTIMADQSITVATGVRLQGRLLARIAAITLDTDTISTP
jgi:Ice-binding-like